MASRTSWKQSLSATDRYENIAKLKKSNEARALNPQDAHRAAFAAETEAYNSSESREAYDAAFSVLISGNISSLDDAEPASPGITLGQYQSCHHVAGGLVSEVYRAKSVALKVIVETRGFEPHDSVREVKILKLLSHKNIINLIETFHDQGKRLVLVFPYKPLTLAKVIASGSISLNFMRTCFHDILSALLYLHKQDIIHRDIKPSNIILSSATGPTLLADFGTAWHPQLSLQTEPKNHKVLEVGTTCYRAPETLFGHRAYNCSLDIWSTGAMLAECLRTPPKELFESRDTSEDGNQLGLILSIFKTLGTPTVKTWPEAQAFSTPPFQWYQVFPGRSWEELLPSVDEDARDLVKKLVVYESGSRSTAEEALDHSFFKKVDA